MQPKFNVTTQFEQIEPKMNVIMLRVVSTIYSIFEDQLRVFLNLITKLCLLNAFVDEIHKK